MAEALKAKLKSKVKTKSAKYIRLISGVPFIRYSAVKILNRVPFVKHRLQRLLATVPENESLFIREVGNELDYQDILAYQPTEFKLINLSRKSKILEDSDFFSSIKSLCITGHFDGSYSLASVNRQLVSRICRDLNAVSCFIEPYEGAAMPSVNYVPEGEQLRQLLNEKLLSKCTKVPEIDVRIYHHYPLLKPVDAAQKQAVALFFWEESLVKNELIEQLNAWYDAVIVTAWSVKKALMDSGCLLPIKIVSFPLNKSYDHREDIVPPAAFSNKSEQKLPIKLLHVSSCFPRKGADVLLEAFDRVAIQYPGKLELVIKTFPNPHNQISAWLDSLVRPELHASVTLINKDFSAEEMFRLYQDADVVVLPTRGEGLNLPAIEAGLYKRHIITTGYSSQTDFVPDTEFTRLAYRFSQSQSHVAEDGSLWVDPSVTDLMTKLENLVNRNSETNSLIQSQIEEYSDVVNDLFFSESATKALIDSLGTTYKGKQKQCPQNNLRIELVSTWGEDCGIAEYSKCIVSESLNNGVEWTIWAPQNRYGSAYNIDSHISIVERWCYSCEPDLSHVKSDTDIVWLQHHFAFYGLGDVLSNEVDRLNARGVLTAITLHTTKPLLGIDTLHQMKSMACLTKFSHVFVHAIDDVNTLKRLGLVDNVTLIPHGIGEATPSSPISRSQYAPFTIGSFGFLLPHKGVDVLIGAFSAALEKKLIPNNSRLRLVNAVRADGVSNYELQRCQKLATRLNVHHQIDWHTDFLPVEQINTLLNGCDLVVLPYQHTLESSSGAVRNAVAACPHVATTRAPIFDEVRDITHSIAGFDEQAVENCIVDFYQSGVSNDFNDMLQARARWLEKHSWANTVDRYIKIFKSRLAQSE